MSGEADLWSGARMAGVRLGAVRLGGVRLGGATLARAWAASEAIVRFDERVRDRPMPLPAVLLWDEVSNGREAATVERIATARLLRWTTTLPHGTRAEPAMIDTANATEELRSAVADPGPGEGWPPRELGEHRDLPPLIEAALAFAALEDAAASGTRERDATQAQLAGVLPRRIQVHRILRSRGLTRHVILPIVTGIRRRPGGIAAVLSAWRDGVADAPVEAFAESAVAAIETGARLAGELHRVHDSWAARIGARHDSSAWQLADLLVEQPVINAAAVSVRLAVTPTAARTAIATLVEAGVLEPLSGAKRNQAWRAPAVLAAAEAVFGRRNLPEGTGSAQEGRTDHIDPR